MLLPTMSLSLPTVQCSLSFHPSGSRGWWADHRYLIRPVSCICPLGAQSQELESAALSMVRVQSQLYKKFSSCWLGSEIAWDYKVMAQNELLKNKRQKYARCPADEEGLHCPKSVSIKGNCSSTGILGEAARAQEQGKLVE